jgi:hypothetical protein
MWFHGPCKTRLDSFHQRALTLRHNSASRSQLLRRIALNADALPNRSGNENGAGYINSV